MKKPKYNGKASFKTWLYTIAGNLARDYWRKSSRHGKVPLENLSEFSDDEIELERMYLKDEQKIRCVSAGGKGCILQPGLLQRR